MIEWIVWYADGTSFTSEDGEPHEAPRWGAVVVGQLSKDHGRILWSNKDYFFWEDGEWLEADYLGLIDYLTRPGKEKVVLIGRLVKMKQFHELYNSAVNDPRLPPKTSYDWLEKQTIE